MLLFFMQASGSSDDNADDSENGSTDSTETASSMDTEPIIIENSDVIEVNAVGVFTLKYPLPANLPKELKARKAIYEPIIDGKKVERDMYVIYNTFEDLLDLHLESADHKDDENLLIEDIFVHSDFYRTRKGIGVHSTIDELSDAYPDYKLYFDPIGEDYYAETEELPGIRFLFNFHDCTKTMKPGKDKVNLKITDFTHGALIEIVHVF